MLYNPVTPTTPSESEWTFMVARYNGLSLDLVAGSGLCALLVFKAYV